MAVVNAFAKDVVDHAGQLTVQALYAARAPAGHGFSDLRNCRTLSRVRISPGKATILLRALIVLTRKHTTR